MPFAKVRELHADWVRAHNKIGRKAASYKVPDNSLN